MANYRHGDVLLSTISELPSSAIPIQSKIVADGEATGHSHSLNGMAQIYATETTRYIVVNELTMLTHQEHKTIPLKQGIYEIKIQRELDLLGKIRQVLD